MNKQVEKYDPMSVGVMSGSQHLVLAAARRMERRGEIRVLAMRTDRGLRHITYYRLKTLKRVRAERAVRIVTPLLLGIALLTFVGWMLWSIRSLLAGIGLSVMVTAVLLWLAPHWKSGCSGIHCDGCGS